MFTACPRIYRARLSSAARPAGSWAGMASTSTTKSELDTRSAARAEMLEPKESDRPELIDCQTFWRHLRTSQDCPVMSGRCHLGKSETED